MQDTALKKVTIISLILLISLIYLLVIYVPNLTMMKNIMPEYKKGMDFSEIKEFRFDISSATETKYYDSEGNEVPEPTEKTETEVAEETEKKEDVTSKEVPVNPEDVLTEENFAKVKEIMTNRLNIIGLSEYNFRQDENGYVVIQIPNNVNIDDYVSFIYEAGKFELQDDETKEILLDGSLIKDVFTTTHSNEDGETDAVLVINLNEEGKAKLLEISKTHTKTTDEEGNEKIKSVSAIIDSQTIMRTYFGPEVTSGQLPITIGSSSKDTETVLKNYQNAVLIRNLLKSGKLPITYTLSYQNVFSSTLRQEIIQVLAIIVAVILIIAVAYLIIRFKGGIFISIAWLGFISTYMLLLRFTNSVISMNSIIAIILICASDFIFLHSVLRNKENKSFIDLLKRYAIIGIPMYIFAFILSFASTIPVSSFAIALFWGCVLMFVYNYIITKNLYDAK